MYRGKTVTSCPHQPKGGSKKSYKSVTLYPLFCYWISQSNETLGIRIRNSQLQKCTDNPVTGCQWSCLRRRRSGSSSLVLQPMCCTRRNRVRTSSESKLHNRLSLVFYEVLDNIMSQIIVNCTFDDIYWHLQENLKVL